MPPVIRASLIDKRDLVVGRHVGADLEDAATVGGGRAEVAAITTGKLAPTAVVVSLPPVAPALRTNSTDQAPPPRSRTLTVHRAGEAGVTGDRAVDVGLELGLVRRRGGVRAGRDRDGHAQARSRTGVDHEGERDVAGSEVTTAPSARPVVTLERRAAWAPKLPLRSCSLPNDVVFATWSISLRSCTISFWAACRAGLSMAPVLADSITRSRMRCSIDCTDDSAPSAVCTTEMPFCALRGRLLETRDL